MPKIILIRHGQASAGTDDYDRLSTVGIQQAQLLGQFWAANNISIDAAFCGSLTRQRHTAELALKPLQQRPTLSELIGLNEYDHLAVDRAHGNGKSSDGGSLTFPDYLDIMQRWHDVSDSKASQNDNQSWQAFEQSGWHAVQKAAQQAKPDATLAFFTSGGVVSTILKNVLSLNFTHTMHFIWETRNASMTTLRVTGTNGVVVDYNSVPHLQAENNRELITQI